MFVSTLPPCRRIRHLAAGLLALLCLAGAASAQELRVAGVSVQEQATLAGQKLLLNGAGTRTFLGFRVYVAALYLPAPMHEAAHILDRDLPRRLQITLLRDTTTTQNLDALKGGLQDNHSAAELAAIKTEVDLFFSLIQQVHEVPEGTAIRLDYLPGVGTQVSIGGKHLGVIAGAPFNRAVLKIWLGRDPIQLSLKRSLLGIDAPEW